MTIREFLKQFNIDVDTDYHEPAEALNKAIGENRMREYKAAYDKLSPKEKAEWNQRYYDARS